MSYRESSEPTIDELKSTVESLKGTISSYQEDLDKQRWRIRRLRQSNLVRIIKGFYFTVVLFALIMTFYRWGVVKNTRLDLEKHATDYHEKIVKKQRSVAQEKSVKENLKRRSQFFEIADRWIATYADGQGDAWCAIDDEHAVRRGAVIDPESYYKCDVLFENSPPIKISCSIDTNKCYRKFE